MAVGLIALAGCLSSGSDGAGDCAGADAGGGGAGGKPGNGGGDAGGGNSSGGDSGSSSGGHTTVPLTATDTGYVDGTNDFGILGAWYGYGDSWGPSGGPPGKCQAASHTDA